MTPRGSTQSRSTRRVSSNSLRATRLRLPPSPVRPFEPPTPRTSPCPFYSRGCPDPVRQADRARFPGICEGHCAIFYVYIGDSKDPNTQGGVLTFFVPAVNLDGDD